MEEKTILLYFILIVLSEENLKHLVATDAAPGIICLRTTVLYPSKNLGDSSWEPVFWMGEIK